MGHDCIGIILYVSVAQNIMAHVMINNALASLK